MNSRIVTTCLIAASLFSIPGIPLLAANPDTDRSSANFDNKETGTLEHAKDGGNRALNDVDAGVHTGVSKVKRGAHKAKKKTNDGLNSADKGLHKAGQATKDAGNHALDKVDDTIHDR